MAAKTSPEIRAEINRLWCAGGWTWAKLSRKFGITAHTIRMIVDSEYAARRRKMVNANRRAKPPPSTVNRRRKTPSLAQV